jgi:predicted MPP superfamily phosphohydrolase
MKKISTLGILLMMLFAFVSCESVPQTMDYSDDEPFIIEMKSDTLKILQLTDLHLTYGIDYNDRQTFKNIKTMVESDDFDLVVFTGDLTMSPSGPRLFLQLVHFMETLQTPWTFVFGNHETDFHPHSQYVNRIPQTEFLYFKVGPNLEQGGVGNFRIQMNYQGNPFQMLYFMDSHAERKVYTEEEGIYDYLKPSQVMWYETHVQTDAVDSLLFIHMPLRQYMNPTNITGRKEEAVYPQGIDTGMFEKMLEHGRTKAVFVGHDHLNDFSFDRDGILLAYGLISGYNAYGSYDRGGRIIEVSVQGIIHTYVKSHKEVSS